LTESNINVIIKQWKNVLFWYRKINEIFRKGWLILMKIRNHMVILPESELMVMQIVWDMSRSCSDDYSHITAGAMFEEYPQRIGHLKLTTVLTLITRLINKGCLKAVKSGRANYYIPLIDEKEYKQNAVDDFIETVYNNDTKGLISALLDNNMLTKRDIDDLRAAIIAAAEDNNTDKKND